MGKNTLLHAGGGEENPSAHLVVIEEPNSTFYKDEGGKSNHLVAVMRLGRDDKMSGRLSQSHWPDISCKLHYENYQKVEDGDGILNIIAIEKNVLQSSREMEYTVRYRIEKVSRRKDGRRFRLRCAPLPERELGTGEEDKDGVYTEATNVLSKRKSSSASRREKKAVRRLAAQHNGGHAAPRKATKKSLGAILARLERSEGLIMDLQAIVRHQAERIQLLENLASCTEDKKNDFDWTYCSPEMNPTQFNLMQEREILSPKPQKATRKFSVGEKDKDGKADGPDRKKARRMSSFDSSLLSDFFDPFTL